jgi:hypothetical protein
VNYNIDNWNAIINALDSDKFKMIHLLNRAQLLDDSFQLAKAGYLNFNVILNMLRQLRREYELVPLTAGFRAIEFLLTYLDNQPFYEKLMGIMQKIIDEIYVRVNDPKHPEYPQEFTDNYHQLVKLKVNHFACRFNAESCMNEANSKMLSHDLSAMPLNVNERQHIYCGSLHSTNADTHWMKLRKRLSEITQNIEAYRTHQDEISEILSAFVNCDSNRERIRNVLNDIFKITKPQAYQMISKEDATFVIVSLIKVSSKHREIIMDFYETNYSSLNET